MMSIRHVLPTSPLRLLIASISMFILLLLPSQAPLQTAHAAGGAGSCQPIPVKGITLPADPTGQYTIYGELCNPAGGPSHTVQLLVPGATYSHIYWDWPNQPNHPDWSALYSAVRSLTAAGYSTFNIDRIGIGLSSHPDSSFIDLSANVSVVHQIVGRLRAGTIGGTAFRRVVLEAHSLGSAIAISEAGTYQDVAGVVVTGLLQHFNTSFNFQSIQANQDPSGRFNGLDAGYLTTTPGTRGADFYYAPRSDPAVIAYDERTKETFTGAEFAWLNPDGTIGLTPGDITVPVLDLVGQQDALFCGAGGVGVDCSSDTSVYKEEAPFYSQQAHLQVRVIPNTGHDLNLHKTAHVTYGIILSWLQSYWNGSNQ